MNYKEWLALSDKERLSKIHSWNPYQGDGKDILEKAFSDFEKEFGKQDGLIGMHCGLYHGGTLIIGVTVKKGCRVRLPEIYNGFPVVKLTK